MKLLNFFFLVFVLILSLNFIFAQEMYRVNVSETVKIDEWGLCKQVINNGSYDLTVFTKYASEWYSFNQSPPLGVSFDDCGHGYIWVQDDGIYQSNTGSGYNKIYGTEGWHNTKDGDMVVIDAKQLIVDSNAVLTTQYRCRGLLIYADEAIIDGNISMTGKGAKANPDDISVTGDTPVPPSDMNQVPAEGLVIRRDKSDWSDINSTIITNANALSVNDFKGSHSSNNLFYGTGNKSVKMESKQPSVSNGLVIKIPKIGGNPGLGVTHSTTYVKGGDGDFVKFGTGGGAGGNVYHWDDDGCRSSPSRSGNGATGTIFSGGSGGGGGNCGSGSSAQAFGGNGGSTGGNCHGCPYGIGGFGNDNGGGAAWLSDAKTGKPTGTGGLLILDVDKLELNGKLESNGYSYGSGFWDPSWPYGSNDQRVLGSTGGGSGGGVVVALYKDVSSIVSPSNLEADSPYLYGGSSRNGITFTKGGKGSTIGPIRIDSDCSSGEILYDGICQTYGWKEEGDWTSCNRDCGDGVQTQTVSCKVADGTLLDESYCQGMTKPSNSKVCNLGTCSWELGSWSGCSKLVIWGDSKFFNWRYANDSDNWKYQNRRSTKCKRGDGTYVDSINCIYSLGTVNSGGYCCPTSDVDYSEYKKNLEFPGWTFNFGTGYSQSSCKTACYNELAPNPNIGGQVIWMLKDYGSYYYCVCTTTNYPGLQIKDYNFEGNYNGEDYPHSYAGCAEP